VSWLELLLIPLGFAVGVYGTMVGAGGGFVLVPVLLLIYADEPPEAITSISLAVVFFNAVSGSTAYARQHRIDYLTGAIFAAATLPGAVAGAVVVRGVPRATFDAMMGGTLLAIGAYTWWSSVRPAIIRPPVSGRWVLRREMPGREEGSVFRYSYNVWYGLGFSLVVGFVSSLFGVGGGILHVPVMITLLRFPVHIAVATSQFILVFMSGAGNVVHLIDGELAGTNLLRALLVAAGAIPGAQVGARLARRVRGVWITRLLVVALVVLGVRLIVGAVL
jgi:uncharacterized membrane protein YfcA